MQYFVNWTQTKEGNAAKEGSKIQIMCYGEPVKSIMYGVYKDGYPVLVGQKDGGKAEFKLIRKGIDLKGDAVLKVTCYNDKWHAYGWKDEFIVF